MEPAPKREKGGKIARIERSLSAFLLRERGVRFPYLLSLAIVAMAFALRLLIAPVTAGLQYLTFFPAVALSAILGGLRAGLFSTLLAIPLATFVFVAPYWSLSWDMVERSFWSNLVFLADGALVSFAISLMQRLRRKAESRFEGARESLESLTQKNRSIQTLFDNMFPYVALLDLDGKIVEISRALIEKEGLKAEELVGTSFADRRRWSYDPEVYASLLAALSRARAGETVRYDTRIQTADGHQSVDLQVAPVRDEAGRIAALLLSSVDISAREEAVRRLKESDDRFRTLFDAAADGILIVSEDGKIEDLNPAIGARLGYAREEMLGRELSSFLAPPYDEGFGERWRKVESAGRGLFESAYRKKDGTSLPVEVNTIRVQVGEVWKYLSVVRDITERRRVETELRIAAIAFESAESMMVTDASSRILRVNRAFITSTGFSEEEVIGQTPRILKSGRHDLAFYRAMWEEIARTGYWQGEIWDRRKSGEVYPKWLTITAVRDPEGRVTHYVGSHTDISDRKSAEEAIRTLAFHDSLTGLPNRRLFFDRLDKALEAAARYGRRGALIFVDIDNFKVLNDTRGHAEGDDLLVEVGRRLAGCIRQADTVARLGGDEFVVMFENLSSDPLVAAREAELLAVKLVEALREPYLLGSSHYRATTSVGAALFDGREGGREEILRQADLAMYQAKRSGKNAFRFFDPETEALLRNRAVLSQDLQEALEKGQFRLFYQLQVESGGRICGAEALIRWIHPERGIVGPDLFIPAAEESGLIVPLGRFAMEEALAAQARWIAGDLLPKEFSLGVNLSVRQFREKGFCGEIREALLRHEADPSGIVFEITESLLIEGPETVGRTIDELKSLGLSFSIDDFGTGYSSLQYLRRLPIDQIKIDRSFVKDLGTSGGDRTIVSTIIVLAKALSLEIVAEGVETEEQKRILEECGCTRFQGYLFGRPVPEEEFLARLSRSADVDVEDVCER